MKVLKYLFLLLLIAFIGGAVFFSLKDGTYYMTEKKIIPAAPSLIYEQIADFKNWKNWNQSYKTPEITNTLGDLTTGIDGNYSFTDQNGDHTLTFTDLEPDKTITAIRATEVNYSSNKSSITMTLNPVENGTELSWNIKGSYDLKNKLINFITGHDLIETLRPQYSESFTNLENYLKVEMKKYNISNPGLVDYGGGYILYKSKAATMENFEREMSIMLAEIKHYVKEEKIAVYGMPMGIYEKIDAANKTILFSAAIPVKDRIIPSSDSSILCTYMEPLRAVKTTLTGHPTHLDEAWQKASLYMSQQGYISGVQAPFVVYKTDRDLVLNPAAVISEIYLPIFSND